MIYVSAALAVLCFAAALKAVRIVPVSLRAAEVSREAAGWIRDRTLDDDEKERLVRKASLSLMGAFVSILGRGFAALAAAAAPVVALNLAGIVRIADVAELLARWESIVVVSIAMTVPLFVKKWR